MTDGYLSDVFDLWIRDCTLYLMESSPWDFRWGIYGVIGVMFEGEGNNQGVGLHPIFGILGFECGCFSEMRVSPSVLPYDWIRYDMCKMSYT